MRELQEFVKATIALYKYPRAVEIRAALPRTETGKLQRFRLRAALAISSRVPVCGFLTGFRRTGLGTGLQSAPGA